MKSPQNNIIDNWLNENGNPEIDKLVEQQAKQIMEQPHIKSTHLIDLKIVLQIMVNQQRISFKEMKDILGKAGLHYIEEGKWEDETGAIYTNSGLAS